MSNRLVKKAIVLNLDYIDKAISLFNVKTKREAVNHALKVVVEENEIINTHKKIASSGTIKDLYKNTALNIEVLNDFSKQN